MTVGEGGDRPESTCHPCCEGARTNNELVQTPSLRCPRLTFTQALISTLTNPPKHSLHTTPHRRRRHCQRPPSPSLNQGSRCQLLPQHRSKMSVPLGRSMVCQSSRTSNVGWLMAIILSDRSSFRWQWKWPRPWCWCLESARASSHIRMKL